MPVSPSVKQRGWKRGSSTSLPALGFFTRPDIRLNKSSRSPQVILSGTDAAPNIWSRSFSNISGLFHYGIYRQSTIRQNRSVARPNCERPNHNTVHPHQLLGHKNHTSMHTKHSNSTGLWPPSPGWEHAEPSMETWPPGGTAPKSHRREETEKLFLVFSFPS